MNTRTVNLLGNGPAFHRFQSNPFQAADSRRSSLLLSVKEPSCELVRPALTQEPRGSRCSEPPSGMEKWEVRLLKGLAIGLALACVGCGFGIQHIAYRRQTAILSRQLRQAEVELRAVTQAKQSIEAACVARMAEELRQAEMPRPVPAAAVAVKRTARRDPLRG